VGVLREPALLSTFDLDGTSALAVRKVKETLAKDELAPLLQVARRLDEEAKRREVDATRRAEARQKRQRTAAEQAECEKLHARLLDLTDKDKVQLRFEVGDTAMYRTSGNAANKTMTITSKWCSDPHFPEGQAAAYQVRFGDGRLEFVPCAADDAPLKIGPEPGEQSECHAAVSGLRLPTEPDTEWRTACLSESPGARLRVKPETLHCARMLARGQNP